MRPIPSAEALTGLVSYVFETMLTLRCERITGPALLQCPPLSWRTALLPIVGNRPLTVALSSDQQGCLSLGAALFACEVASVDQEMVDDTLRELVNMIAGQVRTAVAGDQSLGLARIDSAFEPSMPPATPVHGRVVLSAGPLRIAVHVMEDGPTYPI
jgi:hypothetical protein